MVATLEDQPSNQRLIAPVFFFNLHIYYHWSQWKCKDIKFGFPLVSPIDGDTFQTFPGGIANPCIEIFVLIQSDELLLNELSELF